jgi:hypothetical protein
MALERFGKALEGRVQTAQLENHLARQQRTDDLNALKVAASLQPKPQKPTFKELGAGPYGEAGIYDVTEPSAPSYVGAAPVKQPLVSMGAGETEYHKELGKGFAQDYREIQKAGSDALSNKTRYARAKQLIEKAKGQTGMGGEARLFGKRLGKLFGIEVGDVGTLEALKGMSVDLTMDVVQKTKGAVSNKEMELFAQTAPGLSNTYEGNLLLLEMYERLATLKQEEAKLARDYAKRNGKFDAGYYDAQAKFHEENPLFTEEISAKISQAQNAPPTPAPAPAAPSGGTGYEGLSDSDLLKGF